MKIGLEFESKGRPIRIWFGWRSLRLFFKAAGALGDQGVPHRVLITFRP